VPELKTVRGLRVVADPAAIDGATWTTDFDTPAPVHRFAPDEAFSPGSTSVVIDDEHAIVVEEHGLVTTWCRLADILPHIDWTLPLDRPTFAQGAIAGVPAKLWLLDDTYLFLYASEAYARELAARLGWLR
jgi:hypothetical protein